MKNSQTHSQLWLSEHRICFSSEQVCKLKMFLLLTNETILFFNPPVHKIITFFFFFFYNSNLSNLKR